MHDIKFIRKYPDEFDKGLARRGLQPKASKILELDTKLRNIRTELQDLRTKHNKSSKLIGKIKEYGPGPGVKIPRFRIFFYRLRRVFYRLEWNIRKIVND